MKQISFKLLENGKLLIRSRKQMERAKWREYNRIHRMKISGDKYEAGKPGRKKIDPELKIQNSKESQKRYFEKLRKLHSLNKALQKQGISLI